jgi:predicted ester cyclase
VSLETNRQLACDIFEKGLNQKQVELIASQTAEGFIDHDIHVETGIAGGPEDMRVALQMIIDGFPDIHVTVHDAIAEGEKVVTRNTWSGTHQGVFNGIEPTGRYIEIDGIGRFDADGRIAERSATIDTLGLMTQLRLLPRSA